MHPTLCRPYLPKHTPALGRELRTPAKIVPLTHLRPPLVPSPAVPPPPSSPRLRPSLPAPSLLFPRPWLSSVGATPIVAVWLFLSRSAFQALSFYTS
mmetsp:Transcript_39740/g.64447  ORF Transcript_39740/g.64447 Transcript_39740/m.64447 type:complete len:97 (-) Transcript_39740:287-577(-)